jgi:hypothetical protein
MANTLELISSVTVGSGGAATVSFSSIPGTYTDLLLQTSLRSDTAAVSTSNLISFNGVTTNLSSRWLISNPSFYVASNSNASVIYAGEIPAASTTASTFSSDLIYIPNYSSSSNKSISIDSVGENNSTNAWALLDAGLWASSSAINAITLTATGNFTQYSTAYLYGISKS